MKSNKNILRFLLGIFMFMLSASYALAQTSSAVRVNIIFKPIQMISVNPSQNTVNIEFNTLQDYENGVENLQRGHLTVSSTSNYEITVKAVESHLRMVNGDGEIAVSNLRISALLPQEMNNGISVASVQLDNQGKSIISSMRPSLETTFDISYRGQGGNHMLDYVNKNGTAVYTTEVVYTIATK